MAQLEKQFQIEYKHIINNVLKWKDYMYWKFSDMDIAQKWYDCFVLYNNMYYWFELKLHKSANAFAFNKVQDHQEKYLLKTQQSGWRWFIVINVNIGRKKGENYICIFDIVTWLFIKDNHFKKSMTLEFMRNKCTYLIENWNLNVLFDV
jgi:penicillin-binding protein-related factor A (putative recombinase)